MMESTYDDYRFGVDYFNSTDISVNDKIFTVNDINIYYDDVLEDGGTSFGQRYPTVIRNLYGPRVFSNCFEWCAGPGFIGFSLLSEKICENLYLGDIYLPNIAAIEKTISKIEPKYKDHVFYHHMNKVTQLPTSWQFDLIVANPPHFDPTLGQAAVNSLGQCNKRCTIDVGWKIHKEFFRNIKQHLMPNGIILLQEAAFGSGPNMFREAINQGGLQITNCYMEPEYKNLYYLEIKHAFNFNYNKKFV